MKPELFKNVILTQDIPEEGLRAGDTATVVNFTECTEKDEIEALLELPRSFGDPFAFVTVPLSAIAPLGTVPKQSLVQAI